MAERQRFSMRYSRLRCIDFSCTLRTAIRTCNTQNVPSTWTCWAPSISIAVISRSPNSANIWKSGSCFSVLKRAHVAQLLTFLWTSFVICGQKKVFRIEFYVSFLNECSPFCWHCSARTIGFLKDAGTTFCRPTWIIDFCWKSLLWKTLISIPLSLFLRKKIRDNAYHSSAWRWASML